MYKSDLGRVRLVRLVLLSAANELIPTTANIFPVDPVIAPEICDTILIVGFAPTVVTVAILPN